MRQQQDMEHLRTLCILLIICTARKSQSFLTGFLHIFQRMRMDLPTLMEAAYMSMLTQERENILTGVRKYLIMVRMKCLTSLLLMVCSGWTSSILMD